MGLYWTVDSKKKMFEVVCDGFVEESDVLRMLDVLVGSQALGYRKLFDGSRGETNMGPLDLLNIGVRIRQLHESGVPLGPVAVVIPEDKYGLLARILGILAAYKRPMRIFSDVKKARAWLDSHAVRASVD